MEEIFQEYEKILIGKKSIKKGEIPNENDFAKINERFKIPFPKEYIDFIKYFGYSNFWGIKFVRLDDTGFYPINFDGVDNVFVFANYHYSYLIGFQFDAEVTTYKIVLFNFETNGYSIIPGTFFDFLNIYIDFKKKNFNNERFKLLTDNWKTFLDNIDETAKRYKKEKPKKILIELNQFSDLLTKNFPLILIVIYITGFIITFAHFLSLNIKEFSFLDFQYLKAGILFYALFIPSLYSGMRDISRLNKFKTHRYFGKYAASTSIRYFTIVSCAIFVLYYQKEYYISLLMVVMLYQLVYITFLEEKDLDRYGNIIHFGTAIIYLILLYFIWEKIDVRVFYLILFFSYMIYDAASNYRMIYHFFDSAISLRTPVMAFIIFIFIFGFFFYKIIPAQLGGGLLVSKKLIINREKIQDLRRLNLLKDSVEVAEFKIYYETSDLYYIKNGKGLVCLNKDFFVGEFIRPQKPFEDSLIKRNKLLQDLLDY